MSQARQDVTPTNPAPEPAPSVQAVGLPNLSQAQLSELSDEARQAEYRRQYLLQLSRRSCPGCGETPVY